MELHPEKTRIVYCKDSYLMGEYGHISFDFLVIHSVPDLLRQTPVSYINNYKANVAMKLLLEANKSVKKIAYEPGV